MQRHVEDLLSEEILKGTVIKGQAVTIDLDKDSQFMVKKPRKKMDKKVSAKKPIAVKTH
nr:hypothetical protein [Brochothrix campestris]